VTEKQTARVAALSMLVGMAVAIWADDHIFIPYHIFVPSAATAPAPATSPSPAASPAPAASSYALPASYALAIDQPVQFTVGTVGCRDEMILEQVDRGELDPNGVGEECWNIPSGTRGMVAGIDGAVAADASVDVSFTKPDGTYDEMWIDNDDTDPGTPPVLKLAR